ncbi:MAG: tRNA (adenosine(37)-N6)-threonylcarbamoyltransferase complex ATPase subunit type 1 TsaE [Pseudanabaenaceae cyanobacterium bins.39]|nr:tRNA (adenosine(37)-N6)-threonylcarbamoyltransferase complex ATPase subunit type 1 TsaE [Pseudanabaenaceae cyanobacterium bins.39]
MKIDLLINSLSQTQELARCLAEIAVANTIILLEGNLGSGKTTFMKAFGCALGIRTTITSPTFTLVDEYTEGRLPLYHIDLYRLETSQVAGLHLEEYWRGEDFALGVVAIEWANKLANIPDGYLKIAMSLGSRSLIDNGNIDSDQIGLGTTEALEDLTEERHIQITAQGERYEKMIISLTDKLAIR